VEHIRCPPTLLRAVVRELPEAALEVHPTPAPDEPEGLRQLLGLAGALMPGLHHRGWGLDARTARQLSGETWRACASRPGVRALIVPLRPCAGSLEARAAKPGRWKGGRKVDTWRTSRGKRAP
jgi:hypothetical protein